MPREVDASRRRKDVAAAEMVVKKEAEPDDRPRPQSPVVREDKPQGPDDVRCGGEQDLTLDQRFADEPELVMLEIAQSAMNELGRGR